MNRSLKLVLMLNLDIDQFLDEVYIAYSVGARVGFPTWH